MARVGLMKTDTEIAELVSRYVAGEMPEAEAEAFEELYFAREDIARLVVAEQVLTRAPALLERPGGPFRGDGRGAWRPLAVAAGFLVLVVVGFLLFRGPHPYDAASGIASGPRVDAGSLAAVTRVRLSPLRAATAGRPAYRFPLPRDPGRGVVLDLPLPSAVRQAGGPLTLALARVGAGGRLLPVWERPAEVPDQAGTLEVLLPGGSLEPGVYHLALRGPAHDRAGGLLMEFGFEVLPE